MKIIQSFWTETRSLDDIKGGWIDARYHLMGWCLSCLLLKKHFGQVHLMANTPGKEILIDLLQLPYSSVDLAFDEQLFGSEVWALNKLWVYARQNEPFLHFDGDAFLWQKLNDAFLKAPLVGQYIEIDEIIYQSSLNKCLASGISFPTFLTNLQRPLAVNAGVIGGQQHQFFKEHYQTALSFVKEYQTTIEKIVVAGTCDVGIILEQCFYKYLADNMRVPITLLLRPSFRSDSIHIVNFVDICHQADPSVFTHVLGSYKHRLFYCMQVENWLKYYFPAYYERINELFPNFVPQQIPLHPVTAPEIPAIGLIDDTIELGIKNRWRRTKKLLAQKGLPEALLSENPEDLLASWQKMEGMDDLIDCFQYEWQRHEKLSRRMKYLEAVSIPEFERLFARPIALRMNDRVALAEHALILSSKKNWHRPEDTQNTTQSIVYEVIVDPYTRYIQEFTQSELNTHLLNAIQQQICLQDLYKILVDALPKMPPTMILSRMDGKIKELFMNAQIVYTSVG